VQDAENPAITHGYFYVMAMFPDLHIWLVARSFVVFTQRHLWNVSRKIWLSLLGLPPNPTKGANRLHHLLTAA
jgi:hypothetical protein